MKHSICLSILAIFIAWAVVFFGPIAASAETTTQPDATTVVAPVQKSTVVLPVRKEVKPVKKAKVRAKQQQLK